MNSVVISENVNCIVFFFLSLSLAMIEIIIMSDVAKEIPAIFPHISGFCIRSRIYFRTICL